MSLSRRTFLIAPGLIATACPAWAQEPNYSASVDLVSLFATVRNRDGAIVKDLAREDFLLEEAGIPRTIRYFSRESDLPLTVGLLVDTSQSQDQAFIRDPEGARLTTRYGT